MLITVLIFIAMLAIFSFAGLLILTVFNFDFETYQFAASAITGIAFFALLGQWCAYLSWKFNIFCIASVGLIILFSLLLGRARKLKAFTETLKSYAIRLKSDFSFFALPFTFAIAYMTLAQGRWLSGEIAFRNGPDTFGWSDAIIFFRDNFSISHLKNLIIPELNGTSLYSSLNVVHKASDTAIYQIPSFTRQIDAEFLLGAHRTGATNMLGNFAHFLPVNFTESVLVAFLMTAIFLVSQLGASYFRKINQPTWFVIFGTFAIGLNCNLLFQTLEGGVGELFVIPFMIFVLLTFMQNSINLQNLSFSLGLLIAIAFTSYFDILFTAMPIFVLLMLFQILIQKKYSIFDFVRKPSVWIFLLLSFIPFATSFVRLAVVPFLHPTAGGWDIGMRPLPDNLVGILSSLTNRKDHRGLATIILEIIISLIVIFYVTAGRKGLARFGFLTVLAMYGYLYFSVYRQHPPYNNYRLWKFSAIASALFPIFLAQEKFNLVKAKVSKPNKREKLEAKLENQNLLSKYHKNNLVVAFLITLLTVSSITWMLDWQSTKKLSFTKQEQIFVANNASKYDFVIDGSIYSAMVTMYGDVHYASPQRGLPGYWTHFTKPIRPILFITNHDCTASSANCLPQPQLYGYPRKLTAKLWLSFPDFNVMTTEFAK